RTTAWPISVEPPVTIAVLPSSPCTDTYEDEHLVGRLYGVAGGRAARPAASRDEAARCGSVATLSAQLALDALRCLTPCPPVGRPLRPATWLDGRCRCASIVTYSAHFRLDKTWCLTPTTLRHGHFGQRLLAHDG